MLLLLLLLLALLLLLLLLVLLLLLLLLLQFDTMFDAVHTLYPRLIALSTVAVVVHARD
ncbi:MAG TPA: hypothetical protein VHU83_13270 [Bryobacteraceae bacterium]|nr:hypothetical protein [Bryobacteraceae bacterium]